MKIIEDNFFSRLKIIYFNIQIFVLYIGPKVKKIPINLENQSVTLKANDVIFWKNFTSYDHMRCSQPFLFFFSPFYLLLLLLLLQKDKFMIKGVNETP